LPLLFNHLLIFKDLCAINEDILVCCTQLCFIPVILTTTFSDKDFHMENRPDLNKLFQSQHKAFRADMMPNADKRIARLKRLKSLLKENRLRLIDALQDDYSARSAEETQLLELMPTIQGINYMCRRIQRWMRPERRRLPLHLQPGKAKVMYQPLGVIGIMVPFNFPLFLTCSPLATALAAGNRAMIKMPETTPKTSELVAELIHNSFSSDLVSVVTGGLETSIGFSKLPFNHLLFTGSTTVGKEIMKAAAENLTPVTLELGGKSPVVIDNDAELKETATRICIGKTMNAGQSCVAPDYVFVPRKNQERFISLYIKAFNQFYPTITSNPDYSAIINDSHLNRLNYLLEDAVQKGATVTPVSDESVSDGSRRFKPVLLTNVNDEMAVMRGEIFGPLLPIIGYDNFSDPLSFIQKHKKPLALYYFGFNSDNRKKMLEQTQSGGIVFNETTIHVAVDDLPFGGTGSSGIGQYHGREGFYNFSKARSFLIKPRFNSLRLLYPPYGGKLAKMITNFLLR